MITIHPTLPANGLAGVRPGEIYERAALTPTQLAEARREWLMEGGTIKDPGPRYGVRIVKFVSRKESA